MLNTVNKVYNTVVVVKSVIKSEEFDEALTVASKKLRALAKTEKKEYDDFYRCISKQKALMDKYYSGHRKSICRAFFAQVKAIYKDKEQELEQNQEQITQEA